jgi:hypothetical protein
VVLDLAAIRRRYDASPSCLALPVSASHGVQRIIRTRQDLRRRFIDKWW